MPGTVNVQFHASRWKVCSQVCRALRSPDIWKLSLWELICDLYKLTKYLITCGFSWHIRFCCGVNPGTFLQRIGDTDELGDDVSALESSLEEYSRTVVPKDRDFYSLLLIKT